MWRVFTIIWFVIFSLVASGLISADYYTAYKYFLNKQYDLAIRELQNDIQNKNTIPETYELLARIYAFFLNDYAMARDVAFEGVKIYGPRIDLLSSLGYSYYKLGQYDKAVMTLSKINEIEPGNAFALRYLGLSYLSLGKPKLALISVRALLKFYGNNSKDLTLLAQIYENIGDIENAYKNYRLAYLISPEYNVALEGYRRTAQKLGRPIVINPVKKEANVQTPTTQQPTTSTTPTTPASSSGTSTVPEEPQKPTEETHQEKTGGE